MEHAAEQDVVDPCPGLDACPLLPLSSPGRGQDDVSHSITEDDLSIAKREKMLIREIVGR